MSLTKIGSIGINTGIQLAGVTTVSTLHVGSGVTLSSDGDVFATGISTFSEDIKVGSGVTISPDGDGFYTGVVTATTFSGALAASSLTGALPAISGANLTNLDASDLASGTVPTARLGSGTASSSTFLRGDSTFQTVNTSLVADSNPQLGANLATNGQNINFGDSSDGSSDDVLKFGAGSDLRIYHDGSNSYIKQVSDGVGNLLIFADGHEIQLIPKSGEPGIKVINDGTVELYYNGSKQFETIDGGVRIADSKGYYCGDGNDLRMFFNGTDGFIRAEAGNLNIDKAGGEKFIVCKPDAEVELYHDNNLRAFTTNTGFKIKTTSTDVAKIEFQTNDHDYSLVGYTGLNRFGIDTHDGLQVRDASASYAVRMTIDASGNTFFNGMTSLTASGSNKGIVMEESTNNGRMNIHAKSGAGDVPGVLFYHSGSHVGLSLIHI